MKRRILIIDDDRSVAEIFRLTLIAEGYEADVAYNGGEGLQKALTGNYALVHTDLQIPILHGVDVIQRIAVDRPQQPVVVVTGYLDDEIKRELDAVPNVVGCFEKPVDPALYSGFVRSVVEGGL